MDNKLLIIGIGVIVAVLIVLSIYIKRKYKRPTDYRALFIVGITMIAVGASQSNHTFTIIGILMIIYGWLKKDKWEANRMRWSNLSKEEKRIKVSVLSFILISVFVGALIYFLP